MNELWTSGDSAKESDMTTMGIHQAVKRGDLVPVAKTRTGILLFCPEDVKRFNSKRASRTKGK